MEEKFELIAGRSYWLCSAYAKYGSTRVTTYPPTRVYVVESQGRYYLSEKPSSKSLQEVITFMSMDGSYINTISDAEDSYNYYLKFLSETKEDCISKYNSMLDFFIEKCETAYHRIVGILESKKF